MRKLLLNLTKLLGGLILLAAAGMTLPRLVTGIFAAGRTYSVEDAPGKAVAIVFGAGLRRDGSPSPVLRDRVETAAALYFAGKVQKLLLSGDNSYVEYNEPGAMHAYAISLGVPEQDLVLDFAGRRTYDTCYRARQIFGLDEALLVTQSFHLPRALFLCNRLGVSSAGVPTEPWRTLTRAQIYWNIRELPATFMAMLEVFITRPQPILGQPEPIFSIGAH